MDKRNPRDWAGLGRLMPALTIFMLILTFSLPTTPGLENQPISPPPIPDDHNTNLASGVDADWWATVQKSLAQREYNVSALDQAWQAPNRAQDLRFHFSADVVRAVPRSDVHEPWEWTWRTIAYGRQGSLHKAETVDAQPAFNRVDYVRGDFVEWYLNTPAGLEQGFDLATAPDGEGPLCVEAEIGGILTPRLLTDNRGISYLGKSGAALLTYDKLLAFDARGRELPGEMQLTENGLRLLVDDTEAVYPVTIDPLLTTPAWSIEGEQTGGELGLTVCTAGDVNGDGYSDVIVGAPGYGDYERGWAFCYHGSADGLLLAHTWDWGHYNNGARFGASVAGLGDVNGDGYDDVAVGAPEYGTGHTGQVRSFHGSASGLMPVSNLIDEGENSTAALGALVTAAGDVNGDGYNDLAVSGDGVYVYYGSDTGLRTYGRWHEDDTGSFGAAIAGVGDINADGFDDLVIGSPTYDTYSHINAGRAQLFLGATGDLADSPSWTTTGGVSYMQKGESVSAAGDMNGDGYADFLVATPRNSGGHDHRVQCYYGTDSDPVIGWTGSGDHVSTNYGTALAPAGDINGDGYADVLIASDGYIDDVDLIGRVDVHYGGPTAPGGTPDQHFLGEQNYEYFGCSIGPAGDVNGDGYADIIIGASGWDTTLDNAGRALVYLGKAAVPTALPNWVVDSDQQDAFFGSSIACLGDVNGDGYSDVLVGASSYDNGQDDEGAAFLFLGTQAGLGIIPFWYCESNQAGARLGMSVSTAGDVNGDGYPEGLVGAPYWDGVDEAEGRAFLWHSVPGGIPFGTPDNADWTGSYPQDSARYGFSVSTAGDVNGDGYGDVIIGVPYYDRGHNNEGVVLGYYGSETGLPTTHDWLRDTNHTNAYFGKAVASAGDFNGDGYSDIIVGSPGYNHPEVDEGLAFIYTGGADGLQTSAPFWYCQSNQVEAELGASVASAGDVDGDGYGDVLVGANLYNGTVTDGGAVFAWNGGPLPSSPASPATAQWSVLGTQEDGLDNVQVASAGDINSDGYGDIIIGLPHYDTGAGTNAGGILMYLGGSDGLVEGVADGWALGDQAYAALGNSVAAAGDVNGDGFDDMIMSADLYNNGQYDEGRVYVFYGNGPNGQVRKIKQIRSDFTGPIGLLGMSDHQTSFGLDVMARSAGGRGRVRLEWQADEYPGDFSSPIRGFSDWFDSGTPDGSLGSRAIIQTLVDGLMPNSQYCWRARIRTDDPAFASSMWLNLPTCGQAGPALRTAGGATPVGQHDTPLRISSSLTNHPNPFNPSTTFNFSLNRQQNIQLKVYDLAGRLVASIYEGSLAAGNHSLLWSGQDKAGRPLSSGIYCARLVTDNEVCVRKILLAK